MYSHDSTDNLLDNLESELTELVELYEDPKPNTPIKNEKKSPIKKAPPPVPARRNFFEQSPEKQNFPVPAVRKIHSLDKKEKNDENEIIQMTTLNSDHASPDIEYLSRGSSAQSRQNTVISLNNNDEKNKKKITNNIKIIHESEKLPTEAEETFFVIKHGKWADDIAKKEDEEVSEKLFKPKLEVISERKVKNTNKKQKEEEKRLSVSSGTSEIQKSPDLSTDSSSLEESPKPKKKSKKVNIKKEKKKKKTEERTSAATEASVSKKSSKKSDVASTDKAIGIFISNTGAIKFSEILRSPKIKISIYNEDNGKEIGDTFWTKNGIFNDDFFNLTCTWNEMIIAKLDLSHLQKMYSNVLIFFEMFNSENLPICWAFLKLFSPKHLNMDQKFKLQFFEYQFNSQSCFSHFFNKKNLNDEPTIFDQWKMKKVKFASTLNIYVKDINCNVSKEKEEDKKNEIKNKTEDLQIQQWRKIPGQACKIPNKIFHKIPLHGKGSLTLKFSHDGNFLAFSEVSRDNFLLHFYKFPEMKKSFTMHEHTNFIHDIDWLKQKTYTSQRVVTASSDFTVIVWKLEDTSYTYTILPHPAFVYASKFLQKDDSENINVVTAGRDSIIRFWRNRPGMQGFELIQELKHPIVNKFTYITSIVTRNADTFYTSSSTGDIIEWTLKGNREYHLNRNFKLLELRGKIINNMDLNPRGNKIYFRVQDGTNSEISNNIFVLGIPTGEITQKFQQFNLECKGIIKITTCGSQIFSTNGHSIRYYSVVNGNLVSSSDDKNFINIKLSLGKKGFVSSMDYHPKDFFFACSIYGNHGCILICSYETNEKDPIEKMKIGSQEFLHRSSHELHQIGDLNNIIRRLDEVFLTPVDGGLNIDDNTFTIKSDSKRSRTYTISQGPATFTINKNGQNDTYEIQRNDNSDDDDTTISESFN